MKSNAARGPGSSGRGRTVGSRVSNGRVKIPIVKQDSMRIPLSVRQYSQYQPCCQLAFVVNKAAAWQLAGRQAGGGALYAVICEQQ